MTKQWWDSKTVQSGIAAFVILLGTTGIDIYRNREATETQVISIVGGFMALAGTINGRAQAEGTIYTPKGFSGPTKREEDINTRIETMAKASNDFRISSAEQLDRELGINSPDQLEESRSTGEALSLPFVDPNSSYSIKFKEASKIKESLTDSSLLESNQILDVIEGYETNIDFYERSINNHLLIRFVREGKDFYVYIPHVEVFNKEGKEVSVLDNSSDILKTPRTPFTLPNGSSVFLESPVIEGGHISWSEMTHGGTRHLQTMDQVFNAKEVCKVVEKVRSHFKLPIRVTSGYRDPATNAAVGGSSLSVHCQAGALDIQIDGVSTWEVYDYVNKVLKHSGGLASSSVFTHIDSAGLPQTSQTMTNYYKPNRRWDYGY